MLLHPVVGHDGDNGVVYEESEGKDTGEAGERGSEERYELRT